MKKINQFDRKNLVEVKNEIHQALRELEEKAGIKIDLGNIRYTSTQFTSSVTVTVVGEGVDTADAKNKADFERYAVMYNLKANDFNKEFVFNGKTFKLKSIKPRSPKYPFVGENGGKLYKLPERALDAIKMA